MKIIHING